MHSALILLEKGLGECLMLRFPTLHLRMTHADWNHVKSLVDSSHWLCVQLTLVTMAVFGLCRCVLRGSRRKSGVV
jgi:hypothetical protein